MGKKKYTEEQFAQAEEMRKKGYPVLRRWMRENQIPGYVLADWIYLTSSNFSARLCGKTKFKEEEILKLEEITKIPGKELMKNE